MGMFSPIIRTTSSGFVFGSAIYLAAAGFEKTVGSKDYGLNVPLDDHGRVSSLIYDDRYRFLYLMVLFLTASAGSVGVIHFANWTGLTNISPRTQSNYGWFAYDGNLVGGVLQGVGMSMTMMEPGLAFVNAGMGQVDARWTVLGGVSGGLGFVLLNEKLKRRTSAVGAKKKSLTFQDELEISTSSAVIAYEVFAFCTLVLIGLYVREVGGDHESKWTTAVIGGILLGISQLISIALTGGTVGVSSAYPSFATHILRMLGNVRPHPGYGSIAFACGLLMSGMFASAIYMPVKDLVKTDSSRNLMLLGGFLTILGSRLAGGCTSGHGLSGCGTLSISSFATLTAMIVGAVSWKIVAA